MQRQGYYASTCGFDQIDNLTYTYTPNTNRIASIADNAPLSQRSQGFNPGSGGVGYTYDANGNLKSDSYKGISTIFYNHLNLPSLINFTSGNSIEYKYDAGGNKLRKTVKVGATVQYEQYYVGGVEYRKTGTGNTRIEAIYHNEGRYANVDLDIDDSPNWRKEYNIKDHLGNTRLSFADKNGNGVIDITTTPATNDILQENHYYPFGLSYEGPWLMNDAARDNGYKYNGKELNDDFGLNWYDYGARFYDAAIGRWGQIDPLSGKFAGWSPYNYAMNNPMSLIDPDGKAPSIPYPLSGTYAVNKKDYSDGGRSLKNAVTRTSTYMDTDRPPGASNPHIGIDYRASVGTTFYNLGDGKVVETGKGSGTGKYVTVEYSNGDKVRFLHLSNVADGVKKGSTVYEGQPLGKTGSSGTEHPHLHIDAIDNEGNRIDPENRNYGNYTAKEFFNTYGGDYTKLPTYPGNQTQQENKNIMDAAPIQRDVLKPQIQPLLPLPEFKKN